MYLLTQKVFSHLNENVPETNAKLLETDQLYHLKIVVILNTSQFHQFHLPVATFVV